MYGGVSADQRVEQRRERLLAAGLQEFGTRGVQQTGVKDICRRAGLTDRYFYESFADSTALFVAVFDQATVRLFDVVVDAIAFAPKSVRTQARAVIAAYVWALAEDPRLARVVFVEAPSAGPNVEQHMRVTLRKFARLVETTARPYFPARLSDRELRFGAVALVGAVERVMIEWQDGELGLSINQIIDYLTEMLISVGGLAGVARMGRR
jgi:AcrR family transcriptional regulator